MSIFYLYLHIQKIINESIKKDCILWKKEYVNFLIVT